jgi:hypothetical protein
VNDRDIVPHVPPRELVSHERLLISGAPRDVAELRGVLARTATSERYEHSGCLRLLLPDGTVSERLEDERAREPAFLSEVRSVRGLALDLPKLLLQFPWLVKDHAPINPLTHDGYVDRLGALVH